MEQNFNSGLRIVAATALVVIVAVTAWHVAERPKVETVEVAPATEQTGTADTSESREATAAAESQRAPATVTDTLPTEPDPAVADVGPAVDAPASVTDTEPPAAEASPPVAEAEPAPRADGPKYANIVPDRAPHPKASAQSGSKSAPPARHARTSDQTVIHVRRLQTQLMVGALSCGRPRMQHNYNSFVTKFDRALKANGRELKSYFASRFGARGTAEMDAFLTKLSNELSLVSMRHVEFCERTDGLFDTVLALPAGEIEAFADRYMLQAVASRGGF